MRKRAHIQNTQSNVTVDRNGSTIRRELTFPEEEEESDNIAAGEQVQPSVRKTLKVEDWVTKSDVDLSTSLDRNLVEIRKERAAIVASLAPKRLTLREMLTKQAAQDSQRRSTGLRTLDQLLDGGFSTTEGELIELKGPTRTGKTQICLALACATANEHKGRVFYIDTSNSFDPVRIEELIRLVEFHESSSDVSPAVAEALERIDCVRAFNVNMLLQALDIILQDSVNADSYSLVIIDSFSSLLYPLVGRRSNLGNGIAHSALNVVREVAAKFRCPVVITNFETQSEASGRWKQGLSQWWEFAPHHRLSLQEIGHLDDDSTDFIISCRLDASTRVAGTAPAVGPAQSTVRFRIGKHGVTEVV